MVNVPVPSTAGIGRFSTMMMQVRCHIAADASWARPMSAPPRSLLTFTCEQAARCPRASALHGGSPQETRKRRPTLRDRHRPAADHTARARPERWLPDRRLRRALNESAPQSALQPGLANRTCPDDPYHAKAQPPPSGCGIGQNPPKRPHTGCDLQGS